MRALLNPTKIMASLLTRLIVAGCGFCLCVFMGCATSNSANTAIRFGPTDVQEVHILTTPFAINFDQVGGADGFAVRVYFGNAANTKPFAVTQGSLEILMFDGVATVMDIDKKQPLCTWKYSARELRNYLRNTSVGVSYTFTPVWEKAVPEKGKITVAACYITPKGARIYSAASSVAMPASSESSAEIAPTDKEQEK